MSDSDWAIASLDDAASVATIVGAVGILAALFQIWQQSSVAKSSFENQFVSQYQNLVQSLPTMALLGESLSESERQQHFGAFYHYVDLCNSQAYHRKMGRISRSTWAEWEDGIRANLTRLEFSWAWAFIAAKSPDEFEDLRLVVPPKPLNTDNPYARLSS